MRKETRAASRLPDCLGAVAIVSRDYGSEVYHKSIPLDGDSQPRVVFPTPSTKIRIHRLQVTRTITIYNSLSFQAITRLYNTGIFS